MNPALIVANLRRTRQQQSEWPEEQKESWWRRAWSEIKWRLGR